MGGRGTIFVSRDAWQSATGRLVLVCILYSMGSIFFGKQTVEDLNLKIFTIKIGYDGASFAGVQAFQPFAKQFGTYNATKKTWALTARTASLMNSLALIGKFLGTVIVGPLTERLGHRRTMALTCITQIIGVIIQVTSKHPPQYTAGRIIIYTAVGLVENVVPTYQSEISPAPLRGFFVGSIQLFLTFGSLIAGIVNNYMAKSKTDFGWMLATGLQALPAVIILAGLPFTPESPRWLVSRQRSGEAVQVLKKLRRDEHVQMGMCELEVAAMREESHMETHKEPWIALFNRKNIRRTSIACGMMALQQLTGVTFSSSYGPTFYKQVGLGNVAFAYAAINNGVSVMTAIVGMIILDSCGRRGVSFYGCIIQALFLCLIGGLGAKAGRTTSETNGMVASFILYAAALHASLGPAAYITAAEIGTPSLREKTMAFSTAINVVVGFVVVFTTPYLMNEQYASLGPNLGYVWGGCAAVGAVWIWFYLPELKGRTLEEMDELFEAKIPAWRFKDYQTSGLSAEVARMHEHPNMPASKQVDIELDQIEDVSNIERK